MTFQYVAIRANLLGREGPPARDLSGDLVMESRINTMPVFGCVAR